MDINSTLNIMDVCEYNPIHTLIGCNYNNQIPTMKIDGSDIGNVQTTDGNNVHIKLSPLLDPLKYMSGSYDTTDTNLFNIPHTDKSENCHTKIMNPFNSAYVDALFYNLSSRVNDKYNIPHCVKYYGEYSGVKKEYNINLEDDIEYICDSEFFVKNNGTLFNVDIPNEDVKTLPRVTISDNIELNDVCEISDLDDLMSGLSVDKVKDHICVGNDDTIHLESDADSDCSSKSSNTDPNYDEADDLLCESDEESSDSDSSIGCDAVLKSFPVHAIYIEKCKGTLDDIMPSIDNNEWESVVFQISITLAIYQKLFDFTHNDLHTSNIMYINTDVKFLYYKFMGRHYKVPTHGKIYKIIDFGRAIYRLENNLIYSDSFESDGDAYGQYNFGPIKNDSGVDIEPNKSFDLTRLGCSIYDFVIDDVENGEDSGIKKLICEWCLDDDGKNVLYKKDGSERYPGFKLYKMISRKVHKHTPENVISNNIFDKFIISRKNIKNKNILNIDNMEFN
uniref:Protein kinase domain-containing protein n=1 Tax=viral metagenome TaxID=1070528 RepID=A0A6C0BRD5_9ZZZZ